MSTKLLEISDVKTKADVHRVLAQRCIYSGYNTSLATFIFGTVTLPFLFTRINYFPRVPKEYKVLVAAFITAGATYYSGIYVKNRCQRQTIRELEEMNLGHLVKDIEL